MIALFIQLLMLISPAIVVVTIVAKFNELRRASASIQWPSTTAVIKKVTFVETNQKFENKSLYQLRLDLAYTVDGRSYQTSQRPFDANGLDIGPKPWVREMGLLYRPEKPIPLFYNPQRPQQATLKAGHTDLSKNRWIVISSVMALFSFVMCLFGSSALIRTYLDVEGSMSLAFGVLMFLIMAILGGLVSLLLADNSAPKL